MNSVKTALTIAGSDSGGGAGIQADLRTFSFHCVHGTRAITCVTAQNTVGVHRVDALPPEAIAPRTINSSSYSSDSQPLRGSDTIDTQNTHGTGCTLSAAIAANLATGQDRFSAVCKGKDYVTHALQYALEIGAGTGPVGHFFPLLARKNVDLNIKN